MKLFTVALMITLPFCLTGQETNLSNDSIAQIDSLEFINAFSMDGEVELKTAENLDSLLNLWYVNQSLETAVDDYNTESDTLIPDF